MIVVIQCAGDKQESAGYMRAADGTRVCFVANPQRAPAAEGCLYARPDDIAANGKTWRELLLEYNHTGRTDLGILPAWRLYRAPIYARLVGEFGVESVYILSAGWGLIRADFLTPNYDITFSPVKGGAVYKRRTRQDDFADFRLPEHIDDDMIFFGGKAYRASFSSLTDTVTATRTLFSVSEASATIRGCLVRRFETRRRTNWHYECAEAFLAGAL
jgi:hypothetical protein